MIRLLRCARELPTNRIKDEADRLRRDGQTIAFTNGCFDILHSGHLRLLHYASTFGDVLIVGVNTDRSVRANKGPSRPLLPLEARVYALTCLRFVDIVVPFDEDTPEELIGRVRPSYLVKGAEYEEHEVVGRQHADTVVRIPMLKDWSTTGIIGRAAKIWSQPGSSPPASTS